MSEIILKYQRSTDYPTGIMHADTTDRFKLESHTSKMEVAGALFQFQEGQWVIIGNHKGMYHREYTLLVLLK